MLKPFTGIKLLINWSNDDPNNTIQLRNLCENKLMKEPRISKFRRTSKDIFLTITISNPL